MTRHRTSARDAIGTLWSTPQDIEATYAQVTTCARHNAPLNAALCTLLDNPDYVPTLALPSRMASALTFAVHDGLCVRR